MLVQAYSLMASLLNCMDAESASDRTGDRVSEKRRMTSLKSLNNSIKNSEDEEMGQELNELDTLLIVGQER